MSPLMKMHSPPTPPPPSIPPLGPIADRTFPKGKRKKTYRTDFDNKLAGKWGYPPTTDFSMTGVFDPAPKVAHGFIRHKRLQKL